MVFKATTNSLLARKMKLVGFVRMLMYIADLETMTTHAG